MITTSTGAKKIEGTDNWREIFDAHNDSVDAYDSAVSSINSNIIKNADCTVTTNTDGYGGINTPTGVTINALNFVSAIAYGNTSGRVLRPWTVNNVVYITVTDRNGNILTDETVNIKVRYNP